MSDNLLTPAEIEALLGQVGADESDRAPAGSRQSGANSGATADAIGSLMEDRSAQRLSPVERKRRDRLWAIHEQVARHGGVALSSILRAAVDVRLIGVEAVTCHQFAAGMETPTCVCLLLSPSAPGQLALELSPTILYPLLDRLLGGSVEATTPPPKRPLTEIEQRLAMRLANCFAGELHRAWQTTFDLQPTTERVETDPRWLSIGPPDAEATVVSFDVRLAKSRGLVNFGIPPQVMDVLDRHLLANSAHPMTGIHRTPHNVSAIDQDQTELTVELSQSPTTDDDVANLTIGDIIATEHRVDAPVIVSLDGEPKFLGRLGATAGRKALRIVESTDPSRARQEAVAADTAETTQFSLPDGRGSV